uniref:Ig-like domain-containing protein n=1 Tax=Flagellimonas sp. TaxID=2058762 RepID=UPI003B5AED94
MKFNFPKTTTTFSFLVFIVCLFSCSKDSDLLSDPSSSKEDPIAVGEIEILVSENGPVVIDAPQLNLEDGEVIVEVSEPSMGSVTINDGNSISYTPDEDAEGVDQFSYTTESTDGNATPQTGTITVTIQEKVIGEDVSFWKEQFDSAWDNPSTAINAFGMARAMFYAESGGNSQEYYYLAWQLDGVIQIWQATGDNEYLEDALTIIETCIGKAVNVRGGNYKGWPVTDLDNNDYARNGAVLYESYLFRYVATLLRVMYQSPNLRDTERYQERYEAILEFTKKHIWEKWYTKSSNQSDIYRVNAHMTSHWARIAMELHIITGENIYKEVFDNISFAGLPIYPGASLRNKLKSNPNFPTAYTWSSKWEGSRVQDTSHGADI